MQIFVTNAVLIWQPASEQVFGGSKFKPEYPDQLVLLFPRFLSALCQSVFRHSTKHSR